MNKPIFIKIALESKIHFRINNDDPIEIRLKSFENNSLVNPMYTGDVNTTLVFEFKEDFLVETDYLLFKINHYKSDYPQVEFGDYYPKLLRYLRWVTQNTKINYFETFRLGSVEEIQVKRIDVNRKLISSQLLNMNILGHLIRVKDIVTADQYLKDCYEIKMYEEILLDAKEGMISNDYRKTIMYCTIAVESALRYELEKNHNLNINTDLGRRYIIVNYNTAKGIHTKDEIYHMLKKKNSFDTLLHEMPLYVMNRSVKLEDKELYDSLKILYSTRNKLVHEGKVPVDKNYLTINVTGAILAYRFAIRAFNWLGINRYPHFISNYYLKISEVD